MTTRLASASPAKHTYYVNGSVKLPNGSEEEVEATIDASSEEEARRLAMEQGEWEGTADCFRLD